MRQITWGRVDHDRTARRDTAEPARSWVRSPGLVVVAAALLAFVVCVTTFALGKAHAGVEAAIVALLAFGAGLSWLAMDRRRIRDAERHWRVGHPAP
jgi:Flp pilus assembly protein TadB